MQNIFRDKSHAAQRPGIISLSREQSGRSRTRTPTGLGARPALSTSHAHMAREKEKVGLEGEAEHANPTRTAAPAGSTFHSRPRGHTTHEADTWSETLLLGACCS